MQRVAALAAEGGAWRRGDSATLVAGLACVEQGLAALDSREEASLALDLRAIHARLSHDPDREGRDEEAPALRRELASRLVALLGAIEARSSARFEADRGRIAAGGLRGAELVEWIAQRAPEQRDAAVEQLLGISQHPLGKPRLDPELVGYIPSGVAPIVQAVRLAPIGPEDVVVDIGAGLGKVALLVHLLTGARVRGIELQPELVAVAERQAQALGLDAIRYEQGDARLADLSGASIVYLYLPFTGATLDAALARIEAAACRRDLVVCTLGLDLGRRGWLRERPLDELWLSIYESVVPGALPSAPRRAMPLGSAAAAVATER